jgi:hypothetical protein
MTFAVVDEKPAYPDLRKCFIFKKRILTLNTPWKRTTVNARGLR